MCEPGWAEPTWTPPHKHAPRKSKPWYEVRESTDKGDKVAIYHNSLEDEDIKAIEMSYRASGVIYVGGQKYKTTSKRWKTADSKHTYVITVDGLHVGASLGTDTSTVRVFRDRCGPVHGHPILERELQHKK